MARNTAARNLQVARLLVAYLRGEGGSEAMTRCERAVRAPARRIRAAAAAHPDLLRVSVRREYDSQARYFDGSRSGLFGGAGSCVRHRAYVSLTSFGSPRS